MPQVFPIETLRLRCEYRVNPLGVDAKRPRFDWLLRSSVRGQIQTAYQILVASSPELLKRDVGDLWDSGKVASEETCQIAYAGKPLSSRMQCYWKVRVWDRNKKPSPWSKVAQWSMGLLKKSDWKAQWIGYDEPLKGEYELLGLQDAHWIWAPEGTRDESASSTARFFRKSFRLPKSVQVQRAVLVVFNVGTENLGIGGCRVFLNGQCIDTQSFRQHLEMREVTRRLSAGHNVLAIEAVKGKPQGRMIAKLVVFPTKGQPLAWTSDSSWKCIDQKVPGWNQPAHNERGWKAARDIGLYQRGFDSEGVAQHYDGTDHRIPPPRYFRKEFKIEKKIQRATVYASALGLYQLWINGLRVGEDEFTPGWTQYQVRCNYQAYDVTAMLRMGGNVIGSILADGWYSGYISGNNRRAPYGDSTRLFAQLEIEYADGSKERVTTDQSWKASLGPLREADIMKGAHYDARLESNWSEPEFNASNWAKVDVDSTISTSLCAHPGNPVRAIAKFRPVKVTQPRKGRYVFDLGQNIAGVCQLKICAKRGTKIVMRHGEWLNPEGTVFVGNLNSARATDTYICRGGGEEEVWTPPFTFHGFQFVEVTGLRDKPANDVITGIALSADLPRTGTFSSSDPVANRLFSNIHWTQRANFIDVPTDCPQRAERLGWTGDAQMYIRTASYVGDVAAFFTKWIRDLNDAQLANGAFPNFAPSMNYSRPAPAAWADAGIICPWTIYQAYGDKRLLSECYAPMARWINYCLSTSDHLIRSMHQWGDWLSQQADTPREVIGTAYFAYSTRLMELAAEALGKKSDARKYRQLFGRIREAFRARFVSPDGRVAGETQTAYVLALQFDLLSESEAALAKEHLREDIKGRGWHLSTGFVGTKDLMTCLSKVGLTDVAYRLFHNKTLPSWGFAVRCGATSIWERWNGVIEKDGNLLPQTGSLAHYAYGAVGEWMIRVIGGIEPLEPGYARVRIRPRPGGKITWAKTRYDSIRGAIETDWRVHNGQMTLNVTIPPGVRAEVHLPCGDPARISESDKKLKQAKDIVIRHTAEHETVCEISSGIFHFTIKQRK